MQKEQNGRTKIKAPENTSRHKSIERYEQILKTIAQKLNKNGVTADDLAKELDITKAYVNHLATFMRKQGVDIPVLSKRGFYKEIIARWRLEKPELFAKYGLKEGARK